MSTIDTSFDESRIPYWAVAQLQPSRTALTLNLLTQEGFTAYAPKIHEHRIIRGRRTRVITALFPGYAFVRIALQWHAAWCPGVIRLGMDGLRPAKVPGDARHPRSRARRNHRASLARAETGRSGQKLVITLVRDQASSTKHLVHICQE
jgi:hypothetical protein